MRTPAEFIIAGHLGSRGSASRTVGSLLVAGHDDCGDLAVIGQVVTGMSQRERRRLFELLEPIGMSVASVANAPPIPGIRWVHPIYVGEIAFFGHPWSVRGGANRRVTQCPIYVPR